MFVNGACSQPFHVVHGVPQGSVVGPNLFSVMVNDIGRQGHMVLFADDTTVYSHGSNSFGKYSEHRQPLKLEKI